MTGSTIAHTAVRAAYAMTGGQPPSRSSRHEIMGGSGTITIVGGSDELLERAWLLARELEQLWSRFLPDSDISRLNWAEGAEIAVDQRTVRLVRSMMSSALITAGDFDPTLLPWLLNAGYTTSARDSRRVTTLPASASAPGNLSATVIGDTSIQLARGTTLDSGGIGKGLAADLICEFVLAEGAWGAMAEISGDIRVQGTAPDGAAWILGIENPSAPDTDLTRVRLRNGALVTSSRLKRRWTTAMGERHHLIDPASGASAGTELATVSVIAGTGAHAEALTKPGFLRDPVDYLDWLPSVGAAGLILFSDFSTATSTNWKAYL